jgi:hypothetical protein
MDTYSTVVGTLIGFVILAMILFIVLGALAWTCVKIARAIASAGSSPTGRHRPK